MPKDIWVASWVHYEEHDIMGAFTSLRLAKQKLDDQRLVQDGKLAKWTWMKLPGFRGWWECEHKDGRSSLVIEKVSLDSDKLYVPKG